MKRLLLLTAIIVSGCAAFGLLASNNVNAQGSNYSNCYNGLSFGCNESLLTASQLNDVKKATLNRNYLACSNGLIFGCNEKLLTEQQTQSLRARALNNAKKPNQIPTSTSGLACAENGSCYGDISALTGKPKTVSVRGYYRRDGTYVRGHYRSKPRN